MRPASAPLALALVLAIAACAAPPPATPTVVESTTATPRNAGAPAPTSTTVVAATATPASVVAAMPTATPRQHPSPTPEADSPTPTTTPSNTRDTIWGPTPCEGEGPVPLVSSPLDPESIAVVEPMGRMAASHVTPTDHLYISNNDPWRADSSFVVRAPADGHIVLIQRFPSDQVSHLDPTVTREDYLMVIAHTCTFFTMYIHTAALAPEVAAVTGEIGHGESWYAHRAAPIPVMAGQAVADYPGFSLDLLTIDTHVTLSGFAVPEHYAGEPWKVHTVDPFDYYVEPARSQLLARNPRTVEPLGGKIDYDVDGKAVGNWFLDGTVDYRGGPDAGPEYWSGHLTIAYDHIDPAQVRISVGRDVGITSDACWICDRVFGVRGNGPDPGTIDTSSGLVKYELVSLEHVMAYNADGEPLGTNVAFSSNDSAPLGAALVQMLDDRTLRFEIVPAVPPSTVSDFSDHAAVYRR